MPLSNSDINLSILIAHMANIRWLLFKKFNKYAVFCGYDWQNNTGAKNYGVTWSIVTFHISITIVLYFVLGYYENLYHSVIHLCITIFKSWNISANCYGDRSCLQFECDIFFKYQAWNPIEDYGSNVSWWININRFDNLQMTESNPNSNITKYDWGDEFIIYDDGIKWKHFLHYWSFVWGIHPSLVDSPHKGQWRVAFIFSLICAERTAEQTIETPMIWDAMVLIMIYL